MIFTLNTFNLKIPTLVSSKLITDDKMNKCGHISNVGNTKIKYSHGKWVKMQYWYFSLSKFGIQRWYKYKWLFSKC